MKRYIANVVRCFDNFRLRSISKHFINLISRQNYAHGLYWFGVPIFQTPTDLFLYQHLIFKGRPNVIIETGVAKGGSVLFACQMLDLLHGNSRKVSWKVICCDINSLEEARVAIDRYGYTSNVIFFQGNSVDDEFKDLIARELKLIMSPSVFLSLDSNHTETHVLQELTQLSPYVTSGNFAVVWDSRIGDLSSLTHYLRPRAWGKKHHAGTGVQRFFAEINYSSNFSVENKLEKHLLLAGSKNGVLLRR